MSFTTTSFWYHYQNRCKYSINFSYMQVFKEKTTKLFFFLSKYLDGIVIFHTFASSKQTNLINHLKFKRLCV